jgi:hypothetical protein
MESNQIQNFISDCTKPDIGKIENFAATVYLVKKYEECKDKEKEKAYEVFISKLNTTVETNFYQVLNKGISKTWPDNFIQTRQTDFEKLVLKPDGKEVYTKVLNMLDLTYKTISQDQKDEILVKEDKLLTEKSKDVEIEASKPVKNKLNEIVAGKNKKAKKDEKLVITLQSNKKDDENFDASNKEGILFATNRFDVEFKDFIQKLDQDDRWWDFKLKQWIIRSDSAVEKVLKFIQKKSFGLIDNRSKA